MPISPKYDDVFGPNPLSLSRLNQAINVHFMTIKILGWLTTAGQDQNFEYVQIGEHVTMMIINRRQRTQFSQIFFL